MQDLFSLVAVKKFILYFVLNEINLPKLRVEVLILNTHTHTHTYIYIYIYIKRKRENCLLCLQTIIWSFGEYMMIPLIEIRLLE